MDGRRFTLQDLVRQKENKAQNFSSAYGPSGRDLSSSGTAQVWQAMRADGVRNKQVHTPLSGLGLLQRWCTMTEQAPGSRTPRCLTSCGGWHCHG